MKKIIITESQYRTIRKHLLESKLRSYVFDWDDNKFSVTTSTLDSSTLIFDASRWRKVDWWKNCFYSVLGENVNDWPFD